MYIVNILVLRPFQFKKKKKTNGGNKHYTWTPHGLKVLKTFTRRFVCSSRHHQK